MLSYIQLPWPPASVPGSWPIACIMKVAECFGLLCCLAGFVLGFAPLCFGCHAVQKQCKRTFGLAVFCLSVFFKRCENIAKTESCFCKMKMQTKHILLETTYMMATHRLSMGNGYCFANGSWLMARGSWLVPRKKARGASQVHVRSRLILLLLCLLLFLLLSQRLWAYSREPSAMRLGPWAMSHEPWIITTDTRFISPPEGNY